MTAFPASAEVSDTERERVATCYEARKWNCAFDGLTKMFSKPESFASCLADTRHGCGFEILYITVSGMGAAEKASAADRREIAERALEAMKPMSDGLIETEGEVFFSALRYEACKEAVDTICITQSADLMRLAISTGERNGSDFDGYVDDFYEALSDNGIRYPIDLEQVFKEVAGMEKRE
jgi:hypothetical protein